jgi:tol-pal system protein YbgF
LALALSLIVLGAVPATSAAADREHQQLMADLRILQEQTQQLQALLSGLGDALKAVNSRLDEQTGLERKAFADAKVQMDALSSEMRVVRERVDETNVRLGSISQEVESLRLAMPEPGQAPAVPAAPVNSDAAVLPTDGPPPSAPPAAGTPPVASGVSPQRMYTSAYADYSTGDYSLAISGFEGYLRSYPKGPDAPGAQLYIGQANDNLKKYAEAVLAYDRVIANYPGAAEVPMAYYKRGGSLENLRQVDRAKQSYETILKQFPDADAARLAQQALNRLNRPTR